mmetsp:Transcript_10175/g.15215  ORF Transcript_10175/g.15215 Transcript_10175/m.15215 type:complete len:87 (-) Transcript_10175:7-267(-)
MKSVPEQNLETYMNTICDVQALKDSYESCLKKSPHCNFEQSQLDSCKYVHDIVAKEFRDYNINQQREALWKTRLDRVLGRMPFREN